MIIDRPIGEVFIDSGLISREEMMTILGSREDTTEPLGDLLVRTNRISVKDRLRCEALHVGVPYLDLSQTEIDLQCSRLIPHAAAMRLRAIPVEVTEVAASVAMVNPLDLSALDELQELLRVDIDPMLASEEDVREAIFRAFGAYDDLGELVGDAILGSQEEILLSKSDEEENVNVIELRDAVDGAPIVKLTNALLAKAVAARASDIHLEPQARKMRIRIRIDGVLHETMVIPKDLQHPLTSRIKILSGLDIAERRSPQDGRCTLRSPQGEFDFRISTYPSVHGETVVIRILDKQTPMIDMGRLGIGAATLGMMQSKLAEPQGLVIVTGPTGSGKTTTLYSCVNHLNSLSTKIITIEDPVEYEFEGITQANVNPRAGLSFATGLRSILRQDPDVILVGEIRDPETARIAVEASLTGHLVLTSMHANDSIAAITRLLDMGVEASLIASSLGCSIAQRLIRTNCPRCTQPYDAEPAALAKLGLDEQTELKRGRGCEFCAKTGYRGRTGIYEVLNVDSQVRRLISESLPSGAIRQYAEQQGMTSLRDDGKSKVVNGVTTPEEVIRATVDG